ncbi:MAG: hypothetical protein ABI600_08120 [Luteolibacter sp.]
MIIVPVVVPDRGKEIADRSSARASASLPDKTCIVAASRSNVISDGLPLGNL